MVGLVAKRQSVTNPDNTLYATKRLIGRRMKVGGQALTLRVMTAHYFYSTGLIVSYSHVPYKQVTTVDLNDRIEMFCTKAMESFVWQHYSYVEQLAKE